VKALVPRHLDQQAGEGGYASLCPPYGSGAGRRCCRSFRGRWDWKLRREVTYPRVVPANAGTHTAWSQFWRKLEQQLRITTKSCGYGSLRPRAIAH